MSVLPIVWSNCQSVHQFVCPTVRLSNSLSIHLIVCPTVCMSNNLSVCLSSFELNVYFHFLELFPLLSRSAKIAFFSTIELKFTRRRTNSQFDSHKKKTTTSNKSVKSNNRKSEKLVPLKAKNFGSQPVFKVFKLYYKLSQKSEENCETI